MIYFSDFGVTAAPVIPITSGRSFHYDIQDLSTLFSDSAGTTPATVNGAVMYVTDKSGNGRHISQSVAGAGPTLRQSGSYYYLDFDGVNDSLFYTGTNIPCATAIATALIVGSSDTSNAGLLTNRTDQGADIDFVWTRNALNNAWRSSQAAGDAMSDSTHMWMNQVQTVSFTPSVVKVYAADATGHPGTARLPTGIRVGNDRTIAGRDMEGRLYEMVAYDTILSGGDRNSVENYMASKYAITF